MKRQIQIISKSHKGLLYVESMEPGEGGYCEGSKPGSTEPRGSVALSSSRKTLRP